MTGVPRTAFAPGAVLLVAVDRRPLWILGALFPVMTIVVCLQVAETRDPPFELWGVLLKVFQAAILVLLVVLALPRIGRRDSQEATRSANGAPRG